MAVQTLPAQRCSRRGRDLRYGEFQAALESFPAPPLEPLATVPEKATSSQLFTCFYYGLTHPLCCSTMFTSGLIQHLPGSGDRHEIEAASERANPVDADLGTRRGLAGRRPGRAECVALEIDSTRSSSGGRNPTRLLAGAQDF